MIEELAIDYAAAQISQVKKAYQHEQPLFNGEIPAYGAADTALTFKLVNSFAVLEKAQQVAREMLNTCRKSCAHQARLSKRRAN